MNVLLLEDNEALNRGITKVLELDDYNIRSFADGESLVANISEDVDLYILDINVPRINGLDASKMIMDHNKYAQIIIISADHSINSIQQAYSHGCIDFLKKPFHIDELRLKIARLSKTSKEELFASINLKVPLTEFSKKEKNLLELLARNKDEVVTYSTIDEVIYGENTTMSTDALRSLVKRLRSKLKDDCIKTMVHEGYMLSDI